MNICRRYQRTMQNNYIILETDKKDKTTSYQERMFLENRIEGLLPVKISYIDEKKEYYYEISNKISIKEAFEIEKMTLEHLYGLLFQIGKTIEKLGNYMLEDVNLLIGPEDIYVSVDKKEYFFLFLPDREKGNNEAAREEFIKTAQFLIQVISQEDLSAVKVAYMLEKEAREENFSLQEFLILIRQMKTNDAEERKGKYNVEERIIKEVPSSKKEDAQDSGITGKINKTKSIVNSKKRIVLLCGLAISYIFVASIIAKTFMFDFEKSIFLLSLLMAVTVFCIIQTAIEIIRTKNENKKETNSE